MINLPQDEEIVDIVNAIDAILEEHVASIGPANLCSILLSRIVLLSHHEPSMGKDLIRYVWERLDEIEQNNTPGDLYD